MQLSKTITIVLFFTIVTTFFATLNYSSQVHATVNRPTSQISIGQQVTINGEQFVKVNNNGLLMMTSTYSCPHGKKIAGLWVKCIACDDAHGYYDYNADSCACTSGWNYRASDHACLTCPSNSSWNASGQVCKCSANYYMQGDNANCQSCPEHSTSAAGSTSVNNCSCDKGYYLSDSSCAACPAGATTQGSGSTSISACICGIGYVADSGTDSCVIDTTNYSSTLDTYYDAANCSDPIAWMDQWTGCSSLATVINNESVTEQELAAKTVCLLDPRDHRSYRVRRFDDDGIAGESSGDQCWMIDSMRFGGDYGEIDGCSANSGAGNYSSGGANSLAKAQETFSTTYYGHCRAINSTYNNYLYDWVATMQSTLAYYGSSTTYTPPHQGLCPTGWHLPTGGSGSEYAALTSRYGTNSTAVTNFWTASSKWNGRFSGYADGSNGSLNTQGSYGYYWSSSAYSSSYAYYLYFFSSIANASSYGNKHYGSAVRCIKD
ncbi:hypothetical protein IJJ27_01485 [bacterium]|nr:hypothetical protein [bacterium]